MIDNYIPFWTPVYFDTENKSWLQTIEEFGDNCFYFGGRKAVVLNTKAGNSYSVTFHEESLSVLEIAEKIATLTLLIIIALPIKIIFRLYNQFQEKKPPVVIPETVIKGISNVSSGTIKTNLPGGFDWGNYTCFLAAAPASFKTTAGCTGLFRKIDSIREKIF